MPKFKPGDIVSISGSSGIVKFVSSGEEETRYLIQFEVGGQDWFEEHQIRASMQEEETLKSAPKRTPWRKDTELKEAILDAWYELSEQTFENAYELYNGYGAAMLEDLRKTNEDLYKSCYLRGHKLLGIRVYKQ